MGPECATPSPPKGMVGHKQPHGAAPPTCRIPMAPYTVNSAATSEHNGTLKVLRWFKKVRMSWFLVVRRWVQDQ